MSQRFLSAHTGVAVLCLASGLCAAMGLHDALQPRVDWQRLLKLPSPMSVRVGIKPVQPQERAQEAATTPLAVPAREPAPSSSPAPRQASARYKVQAEVSAPPQAPEGASSRSAQGPSDGEGWQELPTLSQPELELDANAQQAAALLPLLPAPVEQATGLLQPEPSAAPVLPAISTAEAPAAPPEPSPYLEPPGGEVLVMEVFVNERGEVVDARIVVPSAYPLDDFGHLLIEKRARWSHMVPPMLPGEIRKYERRIDYRLGRIPGTNSTLP